ncbi:MAG: recombinase family protein [Bacteroidales bacterium]
MIAIYCRKSGKKEEGKDTSIQTQKDEGVKFASSQGLSYKFFVDDGISGAKEEILDRPQFAEMLAAIEKKEVTVVYCFDQSRIERNAKIWQLFQYIMQKNECKFYPAGTYTDLNDPMTIMLTGVMSLANQLYSSLTSKKVKLAFKSRALKGKTHGLIAYGYEKDENGFYKINDEQANIIRRIYQLSLEGNGCYTIAKILNKEGIPTKYNSFSGVIKRIDEFTRKATEFKKEDIKWRGNVIHDMIVNKIYKGIRKWNDEEVKIPPIITEDLWDNVNQHLQENKKHSGKRGEYRYLLNGLLYCYDCGNEYRGKKRIASKESAYKCKGKFLHDFKCPTSRGISIAKIETFIIHHLFLNKELEKHLSALPSNPEEPNRLKWKLEKQQLQLVLLDRKIEKLRKLLTDGELETDEALIGDYKTAKKSKDDLQTNIKIIENQLYDAKHNMAKTRFKNAIGEYVLTASFESTKKLVHSLVEKITIKHTKLMKGGSFSVEIKYKGFEETSIFFTDWQAIEWTWQYHYRNEAITESDLQEDFSSLKYALEKKGIDINSVPNIENFTGFETVESGLGSIKLNPKELIFFN